MSQETEQIGPAPKNPDIDSISVLKLYEGKRVKHELIYGVVKSRNTGLFHHDYANFKTYRKRKDQPWKLDPAASFTLSEDREGSLSEALSFLAQVRQAAQPASELTELNEANRSTPTPLSESSHSDLSDSLQLWQAIAALSPVQQMELSSHVFEGLKQTMPLAECVSLLQSTVPADQLHDAQELFQVAQWRAVLKTLKQLIKEHVSISEIAEFIKRESWLLGSNGLAFASALSSRHLQNTQLQLLHFNDPYGDLLLGLGPLDLNLIETEPEQQGLPSQDLLQLIADYQRAILVQRDKPVTEAPRRYLLIVGSNPDPLSRSALLRYQVLLPAISILTYADFYLRAGQLLKNLQARVKSRQLNL